MKVKALTGFGAVLGGEMVSHAAGDVFELPPDVDWLRVGLVAVVGPEIIVSQPVKNVTAESLTTGAEASVTVETPPSSKARGRKKN